MSRNSVTLYQTPLTGVRDRALERFSLCALELVLSLELTTFIMKYDRMPMSLGKVGQRFRKLHCQCFRRG